MRQLLIFILYYSSANSEDVQDRPRRAATARKERLWPHGVIPYEIASNFSGEHSNLFKKGMRHWEERTCVSFVPKQPDDRHFILFTIDKCGCCSYVGRRGEGPQAISIGKNCDKFGIVVHELGHVIGFWHEHTRPDRDEFVDIFYRSIQPGQDYNFERAKGEEVDSLGEPYDFLSIMHYARDTFSRGLFHDTILPKTSSGFSGEIGQRIQLSDGDVRQARKMYNCASCGGSLFSSSGSLVANGTRCVWRIIAPEGHTIFLNLTTTNPDGCSHAKGKSTLTVRDGHSPASPVLETSPSVCSREPRMLVSSSNRLYVEASFGPRAPPPFSIGAFDVVCGGPLYASSGRIQSPNYPDAYPPNADCLWSIRVSEGKQVAVSLLFFHVEQHKECIYDRVVVYEGSGHEGSPIATLCGTTPTTTQIVSQRSNQVTIRFISDSSVQKSGFELEFVEEVDECSSEGESPCQHRCINTLGSYVCECDIGFSLRPDGRTCESTCGGFLAASSGQITSPNFPELYPSSKKCVWEIESPLGTQLFVNITHLNIEGTKTECTYDYLRVGDRDKICGEHHDTISLTSKDHRLRVEFASDSSVERTGFSLSFLADIDECAVDNGGCDHTCINTLGGHECTCHGGFVLATDGHNCKEGGCFYQINDAHGEISSPNYPSEYPKGTNCTWHFVTTPGHRLQLRFTSFSLEDHMGCKYDAVSMQDGPEAAPASLGTYCGVLVPPPVLSSSNQLVVHFFSDSSVSRRGFHAEYESICGGQLIAERTPGLIYSHASYTEAKYAQGRTCRWRIGASSPSAAVRLRFESFHIEADGNCQYDYVKVYDGADEDEDLLVGTYCGDTIPPEITTSDRYLTLVLHSDDSVEERGFVAEYTEAVPASAALPVTATFSSHGRRKGGGHKERTTSRPRYDFLVNSQRRR